MFNKKKCGKCLKNIKGNFDYCPHCGNQSYNREEFGLLGKDDFSPMFNERKMPFLVDKIFNTLIKNLDEQFQQLDRGMERKEKPNQLKKGGLNISITSVGGKQPRIEVRSFGNIPEFHQKEEKIKKHIQKNDFSEEKIKKLSLLPKEEPSTNIRRLSNKIVYEINMPEVKSLNDVSIIQLENSIEIKAIGKNKAYFKLIPISLPIINQKVSNGKLILELEAEN
ncbi:MAG: hypothetical protein Q7R52_00560 [archaeon]|nr:hypothetical protein [archaeon]